LPATADEVRRVAAQFAPSERTVYTGAEAEPSVYLRSRPAEYSFIHFAAHAQANAEAPLDSAGDPLDPDEGHKLYARDIAAVAVRAELVTLSACRSAGSRAYAGEGLVGLAWAFLGAGARNVVAGLWGRPPHLDAGAHGRALPRAASRAAPAEALRAAKLGFLRSEGAYRKPFYWATFVIYTRG
jgi:CHAT domain-containing protein